MLISLANPKNFLKKAVLLTCLLSSGVQAVPVAQIIQSIDQPRAEMVVDSAETASYTASELGLEVDSSKIQGVEFFKSKSMRGKLFNSSAPSRRLVEALSRTVICLLSPPRSLPAISRPHVLFQPLCPRLIAWVLKRFTMACLRNQALLPTPTWQD